MTAKVGERCRTFLVDEPPIDERWQEKGRRTAFASPYATYPLRVRQEIIRLAYDDCASCAECGCELGYTDEVGAPIWRPTTIVRLHGQTFSVCEDCADNYPEGEKAYVP